MYDGNQVVRIENKFKKNSLYNIGVEMTERKGTGNYDKERAIFNVEYISLTEKNLYQEVKQYIKNNNIEYSNKPNTNFINGITITSGPEFFQSLGMEFKDSGRTYHSGNKTGQSVLVPNINKKEDIPNSVMYFFDSCMDFLKNYVGKENILLAQIHFDEDTPHLQAYFVPVVNKVKRKCYEKDSNGNVIKEKFIKDDGSISYTPKLLRDTSGKIIYEEVSGKFLNCDQFWKDRGGKNSFSKIQNEFNKFITDKGFNLFRGEIGTNRNNQTKLEYSINEKKAEIKELTEEKNNLLKIIENTKNGLNNLDNSNIKLLSPTKRKIIGYKDEDINKIIEYSKNLETKVNILSTDNSNKDLMINKLSKENKAFKENKELIKSKKIIRDQKYTIEEQNKIINNLNSLVNVLNSDIEYLKNKFESEINKLKEFIDKICKALGKVLGGDNKDRTIKDYDKIADAINYGYYHKKDKNDKGKDLEI